MSLRTKAKLYEFTVILANLEELTPQAADALYRVFEDGTAGSCNGMVMIDFHREAGTFSQAVESAIADVRKAGFSPARIESEEWRLVEHINASLSQGRDA